MSRMPHVFFRCPVLKSPVVAGSPQEHVSHTQERLHQRQKKGMDPEGNLTQQIYFTGYRGSRHQGLDHSRKHAMLTENFSYTARVLFLAYQPRATGEASRAGVKMCNHV